MIRLNGKSLEGIHPGIVITDVEEKPEETEEIGEKALPFGSLVSSHRRTALRVTISFVLMIPGVEERQQVLDRVTAWGKNGGRLEFDWRKSQNLTVKPSLMPKPSQSLQWLTPIKMEFEAREIPYWISCRKISSSAVSEQSGVLTLALTGTAPVCTADMTATFIGGTPGIMNVGELQLDLTGTSAGSIVLSHLPCGIMMLQSSSGEDLRRYRTRSSADDLTAVPGKVNKFAFSASSPVSITISAWPWSL